ncbi:hypothetical protein H5410_014357 [Solanum commersonii]|uniref:Uncharacterized protein n=1 Tax=Solanum commersonii TaxID=4109 RepID=A0A9J5ZQQ2_SOLCO|nr:hypothetical protein H5410_014357 [Solanum commersonii]
MTEQFVPRHLPMRHAKQNHLTVSIGSTRSNKSVKKVAEVRYFIRICKKAARHCLVVMCYRKVPSEEQIKNLLRKKNFREAISLVEELQNEGEMTRETLSFVHAQVGFLLLFDLRFEEAVDHFLLS